MSHSQTMIATEFPQFVPMPPGWREAEVSADLVPLLTPREREILPMLAARWTDREIADALYISYRTVTTHVAHIFEKLGITSRREAAAVIWALQRPS